MKYSPVTPPRTFCLTAQDGSEVRLAHCANISLDNEELVTFTSETGSLHDVTRKSWGYYATGSLNNRLPRHGLRAALVVNKDGHFFIHLVEKGCEQEHGEYLEADNQRALFWFDEDTLVDRLGDL